MKYLTSSRAMRNALAFVFLLSPAAAIASVGCLDNPGFVVIEIGAVCPTQLSTTPHFENGVLFDVGVLSSPGPLGQNPPGGSITFTLFDPSNAQVFTTSELVNGFGSYTGDDYTPLVSGTYYWTAQYSGDSLYNGAVGTPGHENIGVTLPDAAVPEPATLALLGIGLAGLAASRRRKLN